MTQPDPFSGDEPASRQVHRLASLVAGLDAALVIGVYAFGSWVASHARPGSDIDLMLVTERGLTTDERLALLGWLRDHSGAAARLVPGRPLEVTSVVLADVVPWRYPPRCDFLYGEWLRHRCADGWIPEAHPNPDLAIVITTLLQHGYAIRGAPPAAVLDPVPHEDLRRAMLDGLPGLLGNWSGDERNVLLTLARMVVTAECGEIVSKDEAARRLIPDLPTGGQLVLERAVADYEGTPANRWRESMVDARAVADALAARLTERSR